MMIVRLSHPDPDEEGDCINGIPIDDLRKTWVEIYSFGLVHASNVYRKHGSTGDWDSIALFRGLGAEEECESMSDV